MNLHTSHHASRYDAKGLHFAGFNQDFTCFATGLDSGFRIFNADPFKETSTRELTDGGIGIVEMLFRTNYLAIVGGGRNPKYPPNKVVIWDDLKGKAVLEIEFRNSVKAVKLRRDRIIVALINKVFVYSFTSKPEKLHTFETVDNDKGLLAVSSSSDVAIVAIPGRQRGHLQIINLNTSKSSLEMSSNEPSILHTIDVSIIAAHTGYLGCVAVSSDGSKCVSASEKGTLIRVFNSSTGMLLSELRRGIDHAEILSLAFNNDATRLCVSSDKGTIHVFNLDTSNKRSSSSSSNSSQRTNDGPPNLMTPAGNRASSFKSIMRDLIPVPLPLPKYFSSEWSFAQAHLHDVSATTAGVSGEEHMSLRCICGFGQDRNVIIALGADGGWYKFRFDEERGGECIRQEYIRFIRDD